MLALKYNPWLYRVAVGTLFFNQGIVFSAWATRIPDFKSRLNLSDAELGSVLFAIPLGQILVMMLSGWLVSKFSSRNVIKVSAFFYPAMLFAMVFANSLGQLFAALFCFGIAANLNNISINTQGVDVEKIYGRSILGSFHGLWSLAGFTGGVASAFLTAENIGIVPHYIGVNIFSALALLCVLRYVSPSDFPPEVPPEDAKKHRGFTKPTPYIMLLGVMVFGCMSCEGAMYDWSVIYFRDVIGTPPDISRIGFVSYMFAMATGRFASDFFVNKFGRYSVLRVSGVLIFFGMIFSVLMPNAWTAAAGFLCVGFGVSSVVPTCYGLAGRSRRMPSGIAIAVVSSIGFLGFIGFPPIIGFVASVATLRASFAMMACVGLIVTFVAPFIRSRMDE